jgi:hypothetical protein
LEVAVTVAVWLEETALAFAVKVALEDPELTVTLAGTTRLELLLERVTATPLEGAALFKPSVQVLLPAPVMLVGLHDKEVTWPVAFSVMLAVWLTPNAVAVMTGVWVAVTALAMAVNPALDDPAAMVTLAGTVRLVLLLERATAKLDGAAMFKVTVQEILPAPVMLDGAQARLDTAVGWLMVMVEPAPVPVMGCPAVVDPATVVTEMALEVEAVEGERLAVTCATTPLAIVFWFDPSRMQLNAPGALV